jgi:hypothetical protein
MITTTGRKDVDSFFSKSGVLNYKNPHTPFILFVEKNNDVEVEIVDKASDLLAYPDNYKIMSQWKGEWKSDFFQYTVGDVRKYLAK